MKDKDNLFIKGFATAIATLVRGHHEESMAKDIAFENGLTLKDFEGVDEFDLVQIKKALKDGGK